MDEESASSNAGGPRTYAGGPDTTPDCITTGEAGGDLSPISHPQRDPVRSARARNHIVT